MNPAMSESHPWSTSPFRLAKRIIAPTWLALLAACSDPTAEQYIADAQQHLASGDYPAAIIELKNALVNDKDDDLPRARWLLGEAYLETGDVASAEKELALALQQGWNPNDVQPALARALLAQGKFDAVTALNSADMEPYAAAQVMASQAIAELAQGNTWEAESLIANAIEKQPEDSQVKLAQARLLANMNDIPGALVIVEEVIAAAPDTGPAWSLKGNLLSQQRQLPDALSAFDQAIALSPYSFEDRLTRALVNLELGNLDAAQVDADWLLKAAPQHPSGNYVQGLLYFRNDNYTDAITALRLAEPMAQQYPLTLFYLGSANLIEGHREEARNFAQRLVSLMPNYPPGRKLLASIYLQGNQPADVEKVLRPVLDADPDDVSALNLMANAKLISGKTDEALNILARIEQLEPNSASARFRLGAGLLLAGQDKEAIEHMESALELDPQYQQADILLVLNLLQNQDMDGAVQAALAYRQRNPTSVTAHDLLGRVYLANGQTDEASESFLKALSLEPADPAANHALAQLAVQNGDVAKARQYYEAIMEERADYLPALLQLANIDAMAQDESALVAHLDRAIQAHPTALEPRIMLGRYYLWKGKAAQIPALFTNLTELQQKSPQILQLVALAQLAEQQNVKAQYTLEQLLRLEPDSALAHYLLGTAAAGVGKFEQASKEWKQALTLEEDYVPALVSLARLSWAQGDMRDFDQYLQRLTEVAPDARDVLRLRAASAHRAGDTELAMELAQQALTDYPGTEIMLEYAGYQYVAGNQQKSRQIVEEWLAQHPEDVAARMALAGQLQQAGEIEKAIAQYQDVLALEPDNFSALNNLAWHLRKANLEQALAYGRRAATLQPDRPEVLDTLAVLQHLQGDNKQAKRSIDRALAAGTQDNVTLLYHRAMIENALGDKAGALQTLEQVLANPTEFPEKADAEALHKTLKK